MIGSSGNTQVTDASAHQPTSTHVPFGTLAQTASNLFPTSSAQGNVAPTAPKSGFSISALLGKPTDLGFSATSNCDTRPKAPSKPRKRAGKAHTVRLTGEIVKTEFAEMVKSWSHPGCNAPMSMVREVVFGFLAKFHQLSTTEKRKIGEFSVIELGLILINLTFQNESLENENRRSQGELASMNNGSAENESKTKRLEELQKELTIQKKMLEEKDKVIEELQENEIRITKQIREEKKMTRKLQSGIDVFVELGDMHARVQEDMKSSHQQEIQEKYIEIRDLDEKLSEILDEKKMQDAKLKEERGAFLQITNQLEAEKIFQTNKLANMEKELKEKRETLGKVESFIRNKLAEDEKMEETGAEENHGVTLHKFSGPKRVGRRSLKRRNEVKDSSDNKKNKK